MFQDILIIDSCREVSFEDNSHILVRKNDSTFVLCALLMYAVFLASNQQDLVTGTQSILSMKHCENLMMTKETTAHDDNSIRTALRSDNDLPLDWAPR